MTVCSIMMMMILYCIQFDCRLFCLSFCSETLGLCLRNGRRLTAFLNGALSRQIAHESTRTPTTGPIASLMYHYFGYSCIYVTGNMCNQGFHVIPGNFRDFMKLLTQCHNKIYFALQNHKIIKSLWLMFSITYDAICDDNNQLNAQLQTFFSNQGFLMWSDFFRDFMKTLKILGIS